MTRKASTSPPEYEIWLRGAVHKSRRRLPANVRHRIRDLIDDLARNPQPPRSRELQLPEATPSAIREQWQLRRVALEDWRVIYAVSETWKAREDDPAIGIWRAPGSLYLARTQEASRGGFVQLVDAIEWLRENAGPSELRGLQSLGL